MYRIAFLLVVLCIINPVCCPQSTPTSPAVIDAESYTFYSSLYRNSNSLAPEEVIAIAVEPLTLSSKKACLLPSTDEERKMVGEANRLSTQPLTWSRRFDFGRPYVLISPAETDKAIDCIGQRHGQSPMTGCESYAKLNYVRFLSVPIFNADRTRALVAIGRACGGLCGNGSTQVYRKTRDGWELEPNSFARCIWVS